MISSHAMVVLIVAIVMVAQVLRARYQYKSRMQVEAGSAEHTEALRLRDEVKQLKERIHVLERIATDRENTIARQIEELRDS